ncbi:MAG: hypothetical protein SFY69_11485 [Planctomycetota bacterium]|nr:hypothetical protein [Planctomycetota bacterium]
MHRAEPRIIGAGWAGWIACLSWLLGLAVAAAPARGQDGVPTGADPGGTNAPAPSVFGDISIDLAEFGVGNLSRRGDWAGVRLRIRDNGSTQRQVLIRVALTDPDGDSPSYEIERTLNPGVEQLEWVYVRLPFREGVSEAFVVTVHEAEEDLATKGFRAGTLLARTVLQPGVSGKPVLDPRVGVMGLVGSNPLGLGVYNAEADQGSAYHPRGHERIELALVDSPSRLPDRWMGFASLDALVWGKGDPAEVRGERARAVRDWVTRGGHLVIVLPQVGQTWTNAQSNDLHDIMPLVAVQRNENVDLAPYRPLVNVRLNTGVNWPRSGVVHTFRRLEDARLNDAMEILNGPDGRCVAVRRLVGAGAVTLVGLDLNQTSLSQGGLIDAEVFWHRILGKRGRLKEELRDTTTSGPAPLALSRQPWAYDQDIERLIALRGRAAVGVLAGFVVFVTYWLVAGPLGFAALRARGHQRHAWLAFLGVGLAFTGLAWGGATLLRPGRVEGRHVTLLDHVYGQPVQRARMWASVLVPWYGQATFAVPGGVDDGRSLTAIAPWDGPGDETSWSGFTDLRSYVIRTRKMDEVTVPSRSTSKQVQVDWAGGPRWEMPIPVSADGGPGVLTLVPGSGPGSDRPVLDGTLVHKLPGPLTDVTLIVVRGQVTLPRPVSGSGAVQSAVLASAYAYSVRDWPANTPLDVGLLTTPRQRREDGGSEGALLESYLRGLRPSFYGQQSFTMVQERATDVARAPERLTALALFPLLPPPELDSNMAQDYIAERRATHGWDLARWFTQPCVIVIGHLGGDGDGLAPPVPLTVNGEEAPVLGRTVVRWVYPLPPSPPGFAGSVEDAPDAGPTAPPVESPADPR